MLEAIALFFEIDVRVLAILLAAPVCAIVTTFLYDMFF